MSARTWAACFAAAAMTITACSGNDGSPATSEPTTTSEGRASNTPVGGSSTGDGSGSAPTPQLGLVLSEGQRIEATVETPTLAVGTPLTDAEVAAVLARLPEWSVPSTDVVPFNRPVDSLTPPVVGDTVNAPFPPAADAPSVPGAQAEGPLDVVRFQPEGDVDLAPFIAITFNEPMVELATLEQLDDVDVPVEISPDISESASVDGRWRWIGTRTLRFEAIPGDQDGGALDRLPAATEYSVTIPAGTESANGAVLADEFSFTFSTPAPVLIGLTGLSDSMQLDPVFVAVFDQRVDPAAVIEQIDFDAGNVTSVRLATADEIDEAAQRRIDSALPGRALAFVPTSELPTDTSVKVSVGPGVPSLEGPLTSTQTFVNEGQTFAPLRVEDARCDDSCPPLRPFSITFNNALDLAAFDPAWINVEPAVPGLRVETFGRSLQIRGATSGNTTYTVSIAADLVDEFGQTLGDEYDKEFRVGDARPFLVGPNREFVTTDPFADAPSLSYTTVNNERLAVRAWQVTPARYDAYQDYAREYQNWMFENDGVGTPPQPSWPLVFETTIDIDAETDEIVETVVDLSDAFAEAGGPIVVFTEPDPRFRPNSDDFWRNQAVLTWVQTTTLGLDAFVESDEIIAWTTDLLTGEPVAGARVEVLGTRTAVTTDADGVARIPLAQGDVAGLVATSGDETAMLLGHRWSQQRRNGRSAWYVIDDRGVYRPGETARVTGLVRSFDADAQLTLLTTGNAVRYTAYDPQGNELVTDTTPVNALGGFICRSTFPRRQIPASPSSRWPWSTRRATRSARPAQATSSRSRTSGHPTTR